VRVVYTRGGWVNVNNLTDLLAASDIGGREIGRL
jgi:hypothetical protein